MALRLKTVQYAFPTLASVSSATLTPFTQITINLPEATKTIRAAWVELSMNDNVTATGANYTTKTVELQLGSAGYSSSTNSNTLSHSAENISYFTVRDFTSYFITNWSGTSMTCDLRVNISQSTQTNVSAILNITYEYDDTATTQLKTVWIPLNAPTGYLPTTKTSHDTFPALDTYLPEASKTYRSIFIVCQAGRNHANNTDFTVTYELSSRGTQVTGNYEAALSTDTWARYVWEITTYLTTSSGAASSHTFNVWSSLASRWATAQAWAVVTYEFNASTSSSVMNSLMLPMNIGAPMGGTSSADFKRASLDFYVEEPAPALQRLAAYVSWGANGNEAGLNARIGSGSFVAYTNSGSALVAGFKGLMIRNDAPSGISFGRGKNTLFLDIYNTSTGNRGCAVSAFWLVNYTSDKAANGVGAHNHTVLWPMSFHGSGAAVSQQISSAAAPTIPDTSYFINQLGFIFEFMNNGTSVQCGSTVSAERLASTEGGLKWEKIYDAVGAADSEVGYNRNFFDCNWLFTRFPSDADTNRLPIVTSRRYFLHTDVPATATGSFFEHLTMVINYHAITFTVGGDISNSAGGTVNIDLHRSSDGEKLLSTSRSGNGAYSFTWYDNTENVFVAAREDSTHLGRSDNGLATGSP